jgi:hypothetical protein
MINPAELVTPIDPASLPKAVAVALAKRDKAWDALVEWEAAHDTELSTKWLELAETADIRAAIAAVDAGKDATELPSEVNRIRAARPKAIAVQRKLERDVRTAESALQRLYRANAGPLEAEAYERMQAAVAGAEAAWRAFGAARSAVGRAVGEVRHLRDWTQGGRSDAPSTGILIRANGLAPSSNLSPMAQIREVVESYEDRPEPVKRVRVSLAGGGEMVLPEDQAKALTGNGSEGVKILGPAE